MRLFLRNGPPVHYGKIMTAKSASQLITVRHLTESDACHIIIYNNLQIFLAVCLHNCCVGWQAGLLLDQLFLIDLEAGCMAVQI
jgi:hypothetical protein